MRLVLTHYIDSAPEEVQTHLGPAISSGLDQAAQFASDPREETIVESTDQGVRVHKGLSSLDGSEVRVAGLEGLTRLEVSVPWSDADAGTPKLWAASRFASSLADAVGAAA